MKNKKLLWQLPFLTLLVVGTILIIRQQHSMPYRKTSDFIFGTTYHVTYQCDSDLTQSIKAELLKVDASLSPFNKESVITAVNENQDVQLDDMFKEVFNLAMDISKDTDGAFDITVAPLVNAWGFGFKNGSQPSSHQVDSLLQLVGYEKVSMVDGKVTKRDPRIMLDCSAIAKGYGTDRVARLLQSRGIQNYMVEIGGEVVTSGVNPDRVPWKIGVTKPTDDSLNIGHELQTVLNVTDKAMATSGNYRNYYFKGGKKFAHTVDPKTGYPVQHSILSAMVMGFDKARQVLERHPELMAYFIYSNQKGDMDVWYSPSLREKISE